MVNYKCANCNKDGCTKGCGRCNSMFYCSRKCQTSHWKHHKKSCILLTAGTLHGLFWRYFINWNQFQIVTVCFFPFSLQTLYKVTMNKVTQIIVKKNPVIFLTKPLIRKFEKIQLEISKPVYLFL